MREDIVDTLRGAAELLLSGPEHVQISSGMLNLHNRADEMRRAADEIARLRGDAEVSRLRLEAAEAEPCPYVTGTTTRYCTLTPFTLTDEEREAVEWAESHFLSDYEQLREPCDKERADTLRKMLERLA